MATSQNVKHVPVSSASVDSMMGYEGFDRDLDSMIQWRLCQANFERDGLYNRRGDVDSLYNGNVKVAHPPIPEDCPKSLDPNIYIDFQHQHLNEDPPMVPWQILIEFRKKKLQLYSWVLEEIRKASEKDKSKINSTTADEDEIKSDKEEEEEDKENEYSYAQPNLVNLQASDYNLETMISWRLLQSAWQKHGCDLEALDGEKFNYEQNELNHHNEDEELFASQDLNQEYMSKWIPQTTDEALVPPQRLEDYRDRKDKLHFWIIKQIDKSKKMRKIWQWPEKALALEKELAQENALANQNGGEETPIKATAPEDEYSDSDSDSDRNVKKIRIE